MAKINPDAIRVQIHAFLEKLNRPFPSTQSEMVELLERMKMSGYLTDEEYEELKVRGLNEGSNHH